MGKKKGRGRPKVTESIAGENSALFEKVITDEKKYRSYRSIADTAYVFTAASILLSEADSDIEDLEILINNQSQYGCRSILNQLGRMYGQMVIVKRTLSTLQKPLYRIRKTVTA